MQDLRQLYSPRQLNLLFIGESPPAGGTFFYAGNSILFRYTRQAFSEALNYQWENEGTFLNYFRSSGCYLEDLCLHPVNNLGRVARRAEHNLGIAPLTARLLTWNKPRAVIIVGCSIKNRVKEALEQVNWEGMPRYVVAFPAMSHQNRFTSELTEALEIALDEGWINPPVI